MRRWIWIIWVIVGLVIAWEHVYITVRNLELLASAVLAVEAASRSDPSLTWTRTGK